MKLPQPNGRNAPEYYTLKVAAEVLEIVCQNRDLSESDVVALASGLGLTFHVVARPIAMGDTLIIPPNPRPNNSTKLHWMDLQRLIDYCKKNPQFIAEKLQKEVLSNNVIEEFKDVQQINAAARAIKAIEEVLLGRNYTQPQTGFYADTLKKVLIEQYPKGIPKEPTLNNHLEIERGRRGLKGVPLPRDSLRNMLAHIEQKIN